MKKTIYAFLSAICLFGGASQAISQHLIDTANFSVVATIKPSSFTEWPDSVAAWRVYATYDLDGNGKKEFLVIVDPATTQPSDTTMPRILRFEATSDNTYSLVWSATIPGVRATPVSSWPSLCVTDLDKDGNKEIIFGLPLNASNVGSDPNPDRIFIYEYDPTLKNFPADPIMTSKLDLPANFYYALTSIIADDVDGDGDVELILSSRRDSFGGTPGTGNGRTLMIYHLVGTDINGFSTLEREFIDSTSTFKGGYYFNNHVTDLDGDGKKEIWGFTWDMLSFAVYEATGKDTYVLQTDVNQATSPDDYGEQNSVGFFDANHNGKPEMFLAGQVSPPSAVFYVADTDDVSKITASSVKRISPVLPKANFQGATIGDIDGDGEVDFFIGDWSTERMVYHLKHVRGKTFTDSSGYKLDTLYSAPNDSTYELPNVTFADDLDGDGKRELIIVNTNTRADHPEDASLVILESKVGITSVKTISSNAPSSFELQQNFPNPFNPSSTIRFAIKNASNVELVITNSLGQKVATLLNEKMETGTHEVTFNASGLASGTYFYTLKTGSIVQTKKMILMK